MIHRAALPEVLDLEVGADLALDDAGFGNAAAFGGPLDPPNGLVASRAMREYLEAMDGIEYRPTPPAEPVPRLLGALAPRMLELARDRADGAHPHLVTGQPHRPSWKLPSGTHPRERATMAPITVSRNDR